MIVFISNFVSPHIIPLCDELHVQSGNQFMFIETKQMSNERRSLGYIELRNRSYVIPFEDYAKRHAEYQTAIDNADVVMASFGSIDNKLLKGRVRNNRLTFLLSERMFKKGWFKLADPRFWKNVVFLTSIRHKKFHLLCMGAYVAKDFALCGFPKKRMWKFGYITKSYDDYNFQPENGEYKAMRILWVGRMIWWKRPLQVIKAAEMLHKKGYDFMLDIVGGGKLENKVKTYLDKKHLPVITYHGLKKNDEVREMMLKTNILVCTSNRLEGWGAVINEGMNAGCIVVASSNMGATPYLVKDGVTGYSYSGGAKALFKAIIKVFSSGSEAIAKNAHSYIRECWGARVAASRFLDLVEHIQQGIPYYQGYDDDGICSKA